MDIPVKWIKGRVYVRRTNWERIIMREETRAESKLEVSFYHSLIVTLGQRLTILSLCFLSVKIRK